MAKGFSADYLGEVAGLLAAWEKIDASLKVGDLTLEGAKQKLAEAQTLDRQVADLDLERVAAVNKRDDVFKYLRDATTRVRSMVRAVYGPDSSEYEEVGGTRASERKPRTRKTTKTA
jgi:hypothetical protein